MELGWTELIITSDASKIVNYLLVAIINFLHQNVSHRSNNSSNTRTVLTTRERQEKSSRTTAAQIVPHPQGGSKLNLLHWIMLEGDIIAHLSDSVAVELGYRCARNLNISVNSGQGLKLGSLNTSRVHGSTVAAETFEFNSSHGDLDLRNRKLWQLSDNLTVHDYH